MINLNEIKKKTGKQIIMFCKALVEFGRLYHDEKMPFMDEFHPMNYYLENTLNTHKINNIDAALRDLNISTRYACQFVPEEVYGGYGIPARIRYHKDEINNIISLEDISDKKVMQQYLEEFNNYVKNFYNFMETIQKMIQKTFSQDNEGIILYNLASTYIPIVHDVVQKLTALELILS